MNSMQQLLEKKIYKTIEELQQDVDVARVALKELESKTGKKVVSTSNAKGVLDIEKAKKDE